MSRKMAAKSNCDLSLFLEAMMDKVYFDGERFVLQDGERAAALVPIEDLVQLEANETIESDAPGRYQEVENQSS